MTDTKPQGPVYFNGGVINLNGSTVELNGETTAHKGDGSLCVLELAGHAVPTIIHPSNLDVRFDGNAVTAENIIRGEIGMDLRPVNEYARKDWAVRDMTTSIAKAYLRHLFPKLNFNY